MNGAVQAYFDVLNATVGGLGAGSISASINYVANDYCKCSLLFSTTFGAPFIRFYVGEALGDNVFDGLDQDSLAICRPQLNSRIGPDDHDSIPILTNQNTVVSPIDWTGAGWANTATVTPAAGLGPEGTLNANLLASTVAGQYASAALGALYPAGNQVWYCWVKNIDATSLRIRLYDTAAAAERVNVDFTWTGAVLGGTTINNGTDAFPVDMGNGWYCVWGYSNAIVAGNQHTAYVYPGGAAGTGRIYATNANQHPGQGPSRIVGQEVARS